MTQLRDHVWKRRFSSSQDNLLEGFYRPALQEAIRYWRILAFSTAVRYCRFSMALSTWYWRQKMARAMARSG